MTAAWIVLAAVLGTQAVDQIVVTTAPPMDAQRLADALRVYLDEFGIRVETRAAADGGDLRKRLDDARQLGEASRSSSSIWPPTRPWSSACRGPSATRICTGRWR